MLASPNTAPRATRKDKECRWRSREVTTRSALHARLDAAFVALSVSVLASACFTRAAPSQPSCGAPTPDVLFVPTPQNIVDKMLEVAQVKSNDLVYDLGCGDGRIVVTAARRYGARGVGFDIDPERVAESRRAVIAAGVQQLVSIEQKNIFELDLSPATVVTLYLLPNLNVKLIPQLERLGKGARVVSHDFDIEDVPKAGTWKVVAPSSANPDKMRDHSVFLWYAPIRRARGF